MHQQPVVDAGFLQDRGEPGKSRVGVAQEAGQDADAVAGADGVGQDDAVVGAHRRAPLAQEVRLPGLAGHVDVFAVEADPGQTAQGLVAAVDLPRKVRRPVDRIGEGGELAPDDAGEVRHVEADQQVGLPLGEVGRDVGHRNLELDALMVLAQGPQMAGHEGGHGLVDRDAHGPEVGAREPGRAAVDGLGGALHLLGVVQQFEGGFRRLKAVRQPVEQLGTDRVLQRLDAARDGGVADLQAFGGRRQAALLGQGHEDPEVVPIADHA